MPSATRRAVSKRSRKRICFCSSVIFFRGNANWVRLGALNLETADKDEEVQDFRVIERIRHPSYKRPSEYHDIALLRLERDVRFGAFIKPCCLANHLPDTGEGKAIAMGWGRVDWGEFNNFNPICFDEITR